MRVLYLSHGPGLSGGAERVLMGIVEGLDRRAYEPVVVVPRQGQFSDRLEHLGIRYHVVRQEWMIFANAYRPLIALNCALNVQPMRRLRDIIVAERIDVVYTNTAVIFAGGVAAKLAGVPHVWHLHEMVFINPSLHFGFGPQVLRAVIDTLSDRIITVSSTVAQDLRVDDLGDRVVRVSNGLPETAWDVPDPKVVQKVREELGIPQGAKVVIFLGNMLAYKAPDKAVLAFAKLGREDTYLLMVGGNGEPFVMKSIRDIIRGNRLEERVIFTGYRKDVPLLLSMADVSLVPTLTEAWGLATAEAMAAGLPVVAGRGGNNLDLVSDGETGFLIDEGNTDLMAKQLDLLLSDPKLARRMGEAGRKASRQYTIARQLRGIAETIEQAADSGPRKPMGFGELTKQFLAKLRVSDGVRRP